MGWHEWESLTVKQLNVYLNLLLVVGVPAFPQQIQAPAEWSLGELLRRPDRSNLNTLTWTACGQQGLEFDSLPRMDKCLMY